MYTLKIDPAVGYTRIISAEQFRIITCKSPVFKEAFETYESNIGVGSNESACTVMIEAMLGEYKWETYLLYPHDVAYIISNETGKTIEVIR